MSIEEELTSSSIQLLKELISIESLSKEEHHTASLLEKYFAANGIPTQRLDNNVWAINKNFDASKPTILLNSHHDTVKPNKGYTNDPFAPIVDEGKLYGLGSNDAGGCLVSLIAAFRYFYEQDLSYNLILAATAEEEISGKNGIEKLLPELPTIDFAIVGEPTLMDAAISEKGLMVLDCVSHGESGHAAREEGVNALYKAVKDIHWISTYQFPKESDQLGPVKMSATVIKAGTQHNVVPDRCEFTVDVRTIDAYSNLEVLEIISNHLDAEVTPRSTRLNPSSIPEDHPIVQAAIGHGAKTYGSPTMSDQALINAPSIKIGPGDSARSHTADEYIYLQEIEEGIEKYISILKEVLI